MNYAPEQVPTRPRPNTPRVDLLTVGLASALAVVGVVIVYSATRGKLAIAGFDPHYYLTRQAVFVLVGLVAMVVVAAVDYRRLEQLSTIIYVGILLSLVAVYAIGDQVLGGQRWIPLGGPFQFQPSEFATLAIILAIATYCARRPEGLGLADLVKILLIAGIPALLIIKQPDLGTGIVIMVILIVMLTVAGMPVRYIALFLVSSVLLVVFAIKVGLLQHYQIERLTSFISPNAPGETATYNVQQAKDAIGAGGIFGQGLFHGAQTNLAYVPEQQTDFIFSAVGEQLGFVGSSLLILGYGVLAWRILRTAQIARDTFGRLLCAGVFALVVFSVFENIGMNMGIMPVAGIPLPFLSYGGSSIVVFFMAIGLVTSVHIRSTR